ncbi:MoaD/ThiS family protein [Tessaracoccus antarcticus]|uniref:MoaD/ThiS family protein n=1 Tax=Tessaracoccus antarcticus TaxID=2479848 RepID=A0A3M0GHA2_9ACTN|nr:MoaD/ThiS family protein [Tessaracoccus antarcticus]RMB62112.1 MoaD/ThiS family protein [Tessaracoccus antarcticus]
MIQVRLFAAAADAAGTATEDVSCDTLGALVEELQQRHGEQFAAVLDRCSVLVDGRAVTDPAESLAGAQIIDILPPFAGG